MKQPLAVAIVTVVCAGVSALSAKQAQRAPEGMGRIYVSIVAGDGSPVTDVTARELGVREEGEDKRIESVRPATEPMLIELMTDRLGIDATFTPEQTRAALGAFAHTILEASPDSRIGYRTFDGASIQVVKPTSSVVQLDNTFRRTFTDRQNPVLLEAIADACDNLRKAPTLRRMIFVIAAGYKADTSSVLGPTAANALRDARTSLWAVEANTVTGGVQSPNREGILLMGTRDSGGSLNVVNVGTALEGAVTRMARLMLSQYEITYIGAAQTPAPGSLQVGTSRPNVKLLYPRWTFAR